MAEDFRFLAHEPILGKYPQRDGGGTLTLHFPESEYIKIYRLALHQDKNLKVTIEVDDASND